jgi:hypothetical protein
MPTLPVLDPSGPLERRNQALKQATPNTLNTAKSDAHDQVLQVNVARGKTEYR